MSRFLQLPRWPRVGQGAAGAFCAAAILSFTFVFPSIHAQAGAESSTQANAGLDARNAQGLTPLLVAAASGQTATIHSLLAQGANVNATSADGRTALIAAAQNGQAGAVQALIAAGADLNWRTRGTGTALNVAENKGETRIAAMLLAAGAQSTGKSVGDTVCVRPWGGDGYCGTVQSFSVGSVSIHITRIVGCEHGCSTRLECTGGNIVGGPNGLEVGDHVAAPSWCLTETGVRP